MTDDEASESEEKPSQDESDEEEKEEEVKVKEEQPRVEWNTKEEAKQAFKDLLREKVRTLITSKCAISLKRYLVFWNKQNPLKQAFLLLSSNSGSKRMDTHFLIHPYFPNPFWFFEPQTTR